MPTHIPDHSTLLRGTPSNTGATRPKTPAAPATVAGRSPSSSEEGALDINSMDIAQLISAVDHYRNSKNRPTTASDNTFKSLCQNLSERLQDAKQKASAGDREALRDLVTIAAAKMLASRWADDARGAIAEMTSPLSGQSAREHPALGALLAALNAQATTYAEHSDDETKKWLRSFTPSQALTSRRASSPTAHPVAKPPLPPAISLQQEAQQHFSLIPVAEPRRPNREGTTEDQLLPALKSLARAVPINVYFLQGDTGHGNLPAAASHINPVAIAQDLVEKANGEPKKPCVTLYHQDGHWVALMAIPAGHGKNAPPHLIIFDSNSSSDGSPPPSQSVGTRLAQSIRAAGISVSTAFGFIQEGMAANGCGELCLEAINFAFNPASVPAERSHELITQRLQGFIAAFAAADPGTRDSVIMAAHGKMPASPTFASAAPPASLPLTGSASAGPAALSPDPLSRSWQRKGSLAAARQSANQNIQGVKAALTKLPPPSVFQYAKDLAQEAGATFGVSNEDARRWTQRKAAENSQRDSQRQELEARIQASRAEIVTLEQLNELNQEMLGVAQVCDGLKSEIGRLKASKWERSREVEWTQTIAAKGRQLAEREASLGPLEARFQEIASKSTLMSPARQDATASLPSNPPAPQGGGGDNQAEQPVWS